MILQHVDWPVPVHTRGHSPSCTEQDRQGSAAVWARAGPDYAKPRFKLLLNTASGKETEEEVITRLLHCLFYIAMLTSG